MSGSFLGVPELVLDARADLGEGPSWNVRSGCLDWVDIHAGTLNIFSPHDGSNRAIELGEYLGCSAPRRVGGWVLGLRSGLGLLDSAPASGAPAHVRRISQPEPHLPGNRFNDGKCDPAGRFLAGSMDDSEQEACGALYSLATNNTLKTLLKGTRISNGLAWSPDYRIFYYIDTPTRTIMCYDYDLATGEISAPHPVVSVPPEIGWPDGMTTDMQGMLWVAMWGGAKLTRWDPKTGQKVLEVPLPALNVSSCAFGGPNLTDLYVTTARKDLDPSQLARYPLSGGRVSNPYKYPGNADL